MRTVMIVVVAVAMLVVFSSPDLALAQASKLRDYRSSSNRDDGSGYRDEGYVGTWSPHQFLDDHPIWRQNNGGGGYSNGYGSPSGGNMNYPQQYQPQQQPQQPYMPQYQQQQPYMPFYQQSCQPYQQPQYQQPFYQQPYVSQQYMPQQCVPQSYPAPAYSYYLPNQQTSGYPQSAPASQSQGQQVYVYVYEAGRLSPSQVVTQVVPQVPPAVVPPVAAGPTTAPEVAIPSVPVVGGIVEQYLPQTLQKLAQGDDGGRKQAAEKLAEFPCPATVVALQNVLINDGKDDVREAAARSLGKIGDPMALTALEIVVRVDGVEKVRTAAKEAAKKIRESGASALLVPE